MSEPFIGEIRMFPYNFAPRFWSYCNGQIAQISQNPSLYSIISNYYGGDGTTTMGLPNLQGRVPLQAGRGPGLSTYYVGFLGGYPGVPLHEQQIPTHNHAAKAVKKLGEEPSPNGDQYPAADDSSVGDVAFYQEADPQNMQPMDNSALATAGNSQAHENRQPFVTVPYCIALEGIYPSRN